MGSIYLKTNYDGCGYFTAGKLYRAEVAHTVKDDGVKNDAYHIEADSGGYAYVVVGAPSVHLNGVGEFFVHKPESEHARPIMTTEARDILDSIHENIGAETRSESIVKFMDKNTELGVELCAAKVQLSTLEEQSKRRIENLETKVAMTEESRDFWKSECELAVETIEKEKDKRKGWMIYSAIIAVYAIGVSIWSLMQ